MKYAYLLSWLLLLPLAALGQNVGIGTPTPTQTLDVNGNLRVRGLMGNGNRLPMVQPNGTLGLSAPLYQTGPAVSGAPAGVSGAVGTGSGPTSVAVSGSTAYVVNYDGSSLQAFDVSAPSAPQLVGTVATNGNPFNVAVSGSTAYVVNRGSNLQVFDVSVPSTPKLVGTVATGNNPVRVVVSGTTAYVVSYSNSLQVFDVSAPSAPRLVGTVATGGAPSSVAVNGTTAYVVDYNDYTLQVFVSPTNSQTVVVNPDGSLASVAAGSLPGDNLGNYTATQALNLNGNNLTNGGNLAATSLTASSSTATPAVLTPTTGAHNMLAVAYGSIGATSATPFASSGNFSFSHAAGSGIYVLTFTSANLASASLANAPVLVSLYGAAAPGLLTWTGGTGTVTVYTYTAGGATADRGFSFAVFLP